MASASSRLSFKVSKTYQSRYRENKHNTHHKKEFEPMKPYGTSTLSVQSKAAQSATNFPELPQRTTNTTVQKCHQHIKPTTSWKKTIPHEVKSHINTSIHSLSKMSEVRNSSLKPYVKTTQTKNATKSVSFKEPSTNRYSDSHEYDSCYSDEEYDSSYDPDEEEYNRWIDGIEDSSYRTSEYYAYEDEGFEESYF